jgi:hypothetical protein
MWPGHDVEQSPLSNAGIRMSGFVPFLPLCLHSVHRGSFTSALPGWNYICCRLEHMEG